MAIPVCSYSVTGIIYSNYHSARVNQVIFVYVVGKPNREVNLSQIKSLGTEWKVNPRLSGDGITLILTDHCSNQFS
ncbi:hypothetical protein [Parashewanella curva]|uniref:hypothetical protein n=1 Tax=Parashewanella curva TaxID=2338552 RepID=UPI001059DDE6|nr:hypothetical protein [Parashewanella curva]